MSFLATLAQNGQLIQVVAALILALLTPLVGLVTWFLKQKFGITINADQQTWLINEATTAVEHAEEWGVAKEAAAAGDPSKLPTGEQKLAQAVTALTGVIDSTGLPKLAESRILTLINAALSKARSDPSSGAYEGPVPPQITGAPAPAAK